MSGDDTYGRPIPVPPPAPDTKVTPIKETERFLTIEAIGQIRDVLAGGETEFTFDRPTVENMLDAIERDKEAREQRDLEAMAWRALDALHAHALAIAKLTGMKPEQLPRLCVSAACRTIELLMEMYHRRQRIEAMGGGKFGLEAQAELRHQIATAADDLRSALTEAAVTLEAILRELTPQRAKED